MSASDYLLYTGLFIAILATRRPDGKRLLLPVVISAGIGARYLKALPAGTAAHLLELAGLAAGLPCSHRAKDLRFSPADGRHD